MINICLINLIKFALFQLSSHSLNIVTLKGGIISKGTGKRVDRKKGVYTFFLGKKVTWKKYTAEIFCSPTITVCSVNAEI